MSFFKDKPSKSTQSSLSENVNNSAITGAYSPAMQTGANAIGNIGALLGAGGDPQQGYANYLQTAGYAPAMQQLGQNITGQGAAAGLLNSGATSRALVREGANLNNQYFNNYLQNLGALSGLGNQAGQLIANTGQRSTSQGVSTGGSKSEYGQLMGHVSNAAQGIGQFLAFSDRRLKRDIRKLGTRSDGLGIYSYRMLTGTKKIIGVMADEVAKLRPDALGPMVGGFQSVNYEVL